MNDPDEPSWQELRNDTRDGATWWDWYCERPPEDVPFEVTLERHGGWRIGHPVREIFKVRLAAVRGLPGGR